MRLLILSALVACDHHATTVPDADAPQTADVVAAEASGDDGAYTFAVTVRSPDTGCAQYADWWEVVSEAGGLHYRRILTHSHVSEQPFTRTGGPVPVSADETVYVRAHLNTGGYGQTLRGTAAGGFAVATDVATDFAASLAAEAPLPSGCLF